MYGRKGERKGMGDEVSEGRSQRPDCHSIRRVQLAGNVKIQKKTLTYLFGG
jgi:hypothetical protein